ncbi:MAG: hypothetical protein MJ247_03235 [Alphaproteobacteria bacterium]|nr:hypothetical protein [Alphaproteobacteria bacterium]
MNLKEMIVCGVNGEISGKVSSQKANDKFSFYAKIDDNQKNPFVIKYMMPVGGVTNGLYRFPKVGEKVLVSEEGETRYLMGYLPNSLSQDFDTTNETDTAYKNEGLVLRYKKSGSNNSNKEYSEIGFYSKQSDFLTSPTELKDEKTKIKKIIEDDYEYYVNTKDPLIAEIRANTKKNLDKFGQRSNDFNLDPLKGAFVNALVDYKVGNKIATLNMDSVELYSTGDIQSKAQNINELFGQRLSLRSSFLNDENIHIDDKAVPLKKDLKTKGELLKAKSKELISIEKEIEKLQEEKYEKKQKKENTSNIDSAINTKVSNLEKLGEQYNNLSKEIAKLKNDIKSKNGKNIQLFDYRKSDVTKGSIAIVADNEISINARSGITLSVGAIKLKISPTGVDITCNRVNGVGRGVFDSTFSMKQNGSVLLTGSTVGISGTRSVSVGDGLGGRLSTELGNVDIKGGSISTSTQSAFVMTQNLAWYLNDFAHQITALCESNPTRSWARDVTADSSWGAALKTIKKVIGVANKVAPTGAKTANNDVRHEAMDAVSRLISLMLIILDNVKNVLIEKKVNNKLAINYNLETGKFNTYDNRFDYEMAFAVCEATLITTIMSLTILSAKEAYFHQASIKYTQAGSLVLDSKGYYQDSILAKTARAVLAGIAKLQAKKEAHDSNNGNPALTNEEEEFLNNHRETNINDKKTAYETALIEEKKAEDDFKADPTNATKETAYKNALAERKRKEREYREVNKYHGIVAGEDYYLGRTLYKSYQLEGDVVNGYTVKWGSISDIIKNAKERDDDGNEFTNRFTQLNNTTAILGWINDAATIWGAFSLAYCDYYNVITPETRSKLIEL